MLTDPPTLTITEVFGPTFQGEGPSAGRRAGFVRLGRCNLNCSWCDTPYTWDWRGQNGQVYDPAVELRDESVEVIVGQLLAMDVGLVVITGGEPLVQRAGCEELVQAVRARGMTVEFETNGTQLPLWHPDPWIRYNVSPKLMSSGVEHKRAWCYGAIEALLATDRASFKFVCTSPGDLADVHDFCEWGCVPDELVWIMPEGRTVEAITAGLAALADPVVKHGWNLSSRLHVLAWGDERGR